MPAVSQQQQKLFGLALAVKRGEVSRSEASEEVLNIVDSMSEKQIEDFASTSHSGLPAKVEQQMREALRELMREMAIQEAELPQATIPANVKTKLAQAIDKIKDTNLNYNQKLQVIGRVVDSLGIDKKELSKISSKLKTTLESLNEEDPCWKGYQQIGMKKKNGREVPNCVPESVNESKTYSNKFAAWFTGTVLNTVKHPTYGKHQLTADQIEKAPADYKNKLFKAIEKAVKNGDITPDIIKKNESINEVASRTAMEIGGLTGINKDAVQKFVDTHSLDIEKVFQFVKKGKLSDRMDFMTAVAGKPGNKYQKMIISKFGIKESVNELKKLPSGNFSIKVGYPTFADYEKKAKVGDTILRYDKRGGMIKTFVDGSELNKNAEKYLDKVNNITGGVVYLSKKGMKGVAQVPDYEKKDVGVLVLESLVNEDANMNKKVKMLLDKELKDLSKGRPNHQFAVMHILKGALTDANFHSDAKKVPSIFPRAEYEGDPQGKEDLIDMYEYEIGPQIANICKWDGKDIVNAIGFYVSMTIGRPIGQKIEKLVESL